MTKAEIRKVYKEKRATLSTEEVNIASKKIADLLFSRIPIHRFSIIHSFLPIARNNEPDTFQVIETLKRDFPVDIYIPKSLENETMLHVQLTARTVLKENKWGIKEPVDLSFGLSSEVFFEKFENQDILVLLPLLAFDKKGNRVGYGKGYYDKFLAHSDPKTLKVGLSIFEPEEEIDETDSFDQKMDYCITPSKIWQFS